MYEEDIKAINEWFDEHTDYGTYHVGAEYSVSRSDIGEFIDFFKGHSTDCIGIECVLDGGGLRFWESNLEKAETY